MAEVYDIVSGSVIANARFKKSHIAAKENDRFRKKFTWKTDMIASAGFMKLKHNVLADVLFQLKRSKYNRIDFAGLSSQVISHREREIAARKHSAGVIHAGEPTQHIVWNINSTNRKIEICLGSEYFPR